MRRPPLSPAGVYAIVDLPYRYPLAPAAVAAALIEGGVGLIQLRAKAADAEQRRAWLDQLAGPCAAAGVGLVVNDDLALAEAWAAAGRPGLVGVHLGQGDLDGLGVTVAARRARRERLRELGLGLGISTHDRAQVAAALAELDPDYLGFGPVFATASKADPDPVVGVELLAQVCGDSPVPVVAIGGIDSARAATLAATKVAAIAAIGALVGPTPAAVREAAQTLLEAFRGPISPG